MPHQNQMTPELRDCIDNCNECHSVCLETMNHCLQLGGPHAAAEHIRNLQACAEICRTSADIMLMGAPQHRQICGVCAQLCERCAADCERFGDDETMRECAAVCRSCAESCHDMAGETIMRV